MENMEAILSVMNTSGNKASYGIWTHDPYDTGATLYQLS